jgi:predicted N-acyltransferase
MFSVKIHNSIERVKKSDWDRVSQNHGLLQYGWIKAIEHTLSESFTPWYPMLYENDEPVAAMALRQINMAEGEDSFDFHLFGRLYHFFLFWEFHPYRRLTLCR